MYTDPKSVINMRNRTVRLEREGDYWTEEEKEQLVRSFQEGKGITAMAMLLQRTEPAIIQQIEKMDLYQRKTNPIKKRTVTKQPVCLCTTCQLDPSYCPRCEARQTTQEVCQCQKIIHILTVEETCKPSGWVIMPCTIS